MEKQKFLGELVRELNTHVTAKALHDDIRLYYLKRDREYRLVVFLDECRAALFVTVQYERKMTFLEWQVGGQTLTELFEIIKTKRL